jgi:hypothetical protein
LSLSQCELVALEVRELIYFKSSHKAQCFVQRSHAAEVWTNRSYLVKKHFIKHDYKIKNSNQKLKPRWINTISSLQPRNHDNISDQELFAEDHVTGLLDTFLLGRLDFLFYQIRTNNILNTLKIMQILYMLIGTSHKTDLLPKMLNKEKELVFHIREIFLVSQPSCVIPSILKFIKWMHLYSIIQKQKYD